MSHIIASPMGIGLPYSALFYVPDKQITKRREASHYWDKAIAPPTPAPSAPDDSNPRLVSPWFDEDTPALSASEDEDVAEKPARRLPQKKKSFARIRQIAFRAFVPKAGSHKSGVVVSTEVISQQQIPLSGKNSSTPGFTLFNSWRIKSKGVNTQVKKLTASVQRRISKQSPPEQHPKTWEEYHQCYAMEQIDINDPPIPPTDPNPEAPTAYEAQCYCPPVAADESIRQLVINRLGVFGKSAFDSSEEAVARARERTELAEKLEQMGEEPKSLQQSWQPRASQNGSDMGIDQTRHLIEGVRSGNLPPETLEQHPVFRKIVRQCREMFNSNISMISIMAEDRQIFLAESGLDGLREAPRDLTVCAHTVLSGRKGFTILDTRKDWRFANSPLVNHYGARFYAGVPLLAPTLDGAADSDAAACPLGSLCVIDDKPREDFGIEERKKLVYMAEYARREIEEWFRLKMAHKMLALEQSHKTFAENVQQVENIEGEIADPVPEIIGEEPVSSESNNDQSGRRTRKVSSSFTRGRSVTSTPPTSPSSAGAPASKESRSFAPRGLSLFDDMSTGVRPKIQKVFDLATKLVGDTLDLSLVYLLAVASHGDSSDTGRTLIISGYNLPVPIPVFDAGLHLRALRSDEGGLLYQNPSTEEIQDAALLPGGSNPYASAMLVRVGPHPVGDAGGFVIAGFTSDPKRVFGGEDVAYMKQFASELTRYTAKLRL